MADGIGAWGLSWKPDLTQSWQERQDRRFWSKVNQDGPIPEHDPSLGPCWPWIPNGLIQGYGQFSLNGVNVRAHRYAYEMLVGPIPDGLMLDHLCHARGFCPGGPTCPHRRCVNPDHLRPSTAQENNHRGCGWSGWNVSKTHCPRGHPYAGENLVVRPSGSRQCRRCNVVRAQARYEAWKQKRDYSMSLVGP